MTFASLTLLQRGVIHRLRGRGAQLAAEEAHAYWIEGRQCPAGAMSGLDPTRDRELIVDFGKANAQARSGT
jgi:hypothetical protein